MSRKKSKDPGPRLTASTADRHWLYQESVQDSEVTLELFDRIWATENMSRPLTLREDFCGTALLASDWVKSHPRRCAVGIDIDVATLAWGKERNVDPLGAAADRVQLLELDVLSGDLPDGFDMIAALNFSYFAFHDRATLKRYLARAFDGLKESGVFVCDLHGGPDAQFVLEEETHFDGFDYVWDQDFFDPINNHTVCHIHFRFPDGSEIEHAFSYDWRVWSLPELRDLLLEVGFRRVDVWWDHDDEELRVSDTAESLEAWVAYIAAWK